MSPINNPIKNIDISGVCELLVNSERALNISLIRDCTRLSKESILLICTIKKKFVATK